MNYTTRKIIESSVWKWKGYEIRKYEDMTFGGWDYVLFIDGFFVMHDQIFDVCKYAALNGAG